MFIRTKRSKTATTIQIVENHRDGEKTIQRVIQHVGSAHTQEKIDELKRLAEVLLIQIENELIKNRNKKISPQYAAHIGNIEMKNTHQLIDITNLTEKNRCILGIHDIYGYLYNQLGFTNLFTRAHQREESAKILREIVLARIAQPVSDVV